ncbi:MAG: sugar ABC transporter permease [Lachnospiraceae bacterium]|nr:sugar ABC transporter permease [Lachnospiraceae bacterium]
MAILFLLPSLIGLIFLSLLPMLISMAASLTDWEYTRGLGNWNFVGFENFINLFDDAWFIKSLKNTIIYTIGTVPVGIFVALVIASLIDNFCNDKVAGYVRIALYMPNICNIVAVSVIWMALYSSYGPFTNLVRALGWENPPRWLANYHWALPSVMLVAVWAKLGYNVFMYGASMAALPAELYEAADLDGANGRQKFWHLTIPLLQPTTFYLTITAIISSFQSFGYTNVMTKGGPIDATYTLVYYIYKSAFAYTKTGYASAIAVVLFIMLLIVTIIQWIHNNKKE